MTGNLMARERVAPQIINPVSFTNKDLEISQSCIAGSSYAWKLFCVIPLGRPDYNVAVKDLWKNSRIPKSEQSEYELVNIRTMRGTEWGVVVTGQTYLTVVADIAKKRV
ncbi:MAG TPA: hypothetical protein QF753_11225 [Victivallales bacterium]|nr:hypothetical protein [Victivallales bacterium]